MLTSKDANFVGYTYKNSDVLKGMMNSPIGKTISLFYLVLLWRAESR